MYYDPKEDIDKFSSLLLDALIQVMLRCNGEALIIGGDFGARAKILNLLHTGILPPDGNIMCERFSLDYEGRILVVIFENVGFLLVWKKMLAIIRHRINVRMIQSMGNKGYQ